MCVYKVMITGYMFLVCGFTLWFVNNSDIIKNKHNIIMGFSTQCVQGVTAIGENISRPVRYDNCFLHSLRQSATGGLNPCLLSTLKQLGILQYRVRGSRGGQPRAHRTWDTNQGVNVDNLVTPPKAIPTITSVRENFSHRRSMNNDRQSRNTTNLTKVVREPENKVRGQTCINVCCLNARSVKNKTLSLCDYIISNDFDTLAITETWLVTSVDRICIGELVPQGYKMQHVTRGGSKRGGGIAVIHKSTINIRLLSSSSDSEYANFEFMDCNVMINSHSLRLAVIYRPPPSRENGLQTSVFLEQEWPSFLSKYATHDKDIIIVGDLNFHLDIPTDRDASKFTSLLESCGMSQHVHEPTHVGGHTLDVVITRDTDNIVSDIQVTDPGLSDSTGKISRDHFSVTFKARASKPPPTRQTVTYRKLRAIDVDTFKNDILNSEVINKSIHLTNVDELVDAYTTGLTLLIDKHAPLRTRTIVLRPTCPWYTEELHEAKHLRRKLERKWQNSRLTVDHQIYRDQCVIVNKLLKQARIQYYSEKIDSYENDKKHLFKVTKDILGCAKEVVLPSNKNSKELANEFSDFFTDKIERIRDDIKTKNQQFPQTVTSTQDDIDLPPTSHLNSFIPVTSKDVCGIIKRSPTKSCELDPIPTWLLKQCLNELSPILTNIINVSLQSAHVPKAFKSSLVRPLLKKPSLDPDNFKNYRPVSNLPFLSKVLEKVVDAQIERHLTSNNLHEQHQSAYRKFHSTETALIKVQSDILQSLDQGNATVLVLLDLSAAFDTLDHDTLLHRLENHFGITGKPLEWMTSYFKDRFQTVCIDGELSNPVLMSYSVPQGSVLGPKNYIMYTKPVGAICRKHGLLHHFYADDSQLYMSFKPTETVSQQETLHRVSSCLSDIVAWMHANMLKLNADKTEVIVFSSKQNAAAVEDLVVTVGSVDIKPTKCVRNLGAFLDTHLTMEQHVNAVSRSCYGHLRQISHIRPYLTSNATKTLVNSLVTSRIDYCNALLHGATKATITKLQTVQNTAARIVTKTSRYEHITPVLKTLHWLPVNQRIEFKILTHTYKALHGRSPLYIQNMLQIYAPTRDLRSRNNATTLIVPKTRTVTFGDRSFAHAAPRLWNALPDNIRNCDTLAAFKKSLKTHIFKTFM